MNVYLLGMVPGGSDHAWQERRDAASRLWAHALQQDELFVQRNSFFLVAESLLVVAYTGILGLSSAHEQPLRLRVAATVLAIFGFLLTANPGRLLAFDKGRFFWTFMGERVKRFPSIGTLLRSESCQGGVYLARC